MQHFEEVGYWGIAIVTGSSSNATDMSTVAKANEAEA